MSGLRDELGKFFDQLELVEANLLNSSSLDFAASDCDYIVHIASPFPLMLLCEENELITPAVNGTRAVLEAAHKYGIKRVVLTSSITTIKEHKKEDVPKDKVYTEEDWSDLNCCRPYEKSKTLAEKWAWDYLEKLPESERFELVVINPGDVMGPSNIKKNYASREFIRSILNAKYPGSPRIHYPIVDVRNIVDAHFNGLVIPEARNKRFLIVQDSLWHVEIAKILKEHFGDKFKIKTKELWKALV